MSRKYIIFSAFIIHLLVATFSAFQAGISSLPFIGKWVRIYGNYTGTSPVFGFFAPKVASKTVLYFEVENKNGANFYEFRNLNREFDMRVQSQVEIFSQIPETRNLFAGYWASAFFLRNPDCKKVSLVLKSLDLPSIEKVKKGDRSHWLTLYKASFVPN